MSSATRAMRSWSTSLLLGLLCSALTLTTVHGSGDSPSSNSARTIFRSASETAQDIWRMLKPSNDGMFTVEPQSNGDENNVESDPVSVDEALQHIRSIIHILSNTHNALLDKKVADLPFVKRIFFKFFYSHGASLATLYEDSQTHKSERLPTLSNLANSARDFATVSRNTNVIKENINAVTASFANEILLSISALKEAARNAAHGGWLVTPQVKAYVDELTQNFSSKSEKWMQRIGRLADAAKPVAGNIASKEYIQDMLNDMEYMVTDFQEELWRMRTEWVYTRKETLSWATESLNAMKKLGRHELHRLSEGMHGHGRWAKHMIKESFEHNRAHVAVLQQHAAEHVNHFIDLVLLWIDITKGLVRTVTEMLKSFIIRSWRVVAFVSVILFFRFLLNFFTDPSVRQFIAETFSRTNVTARLFASRAAQPDSPASSARSESNPIKRRSSAERVPSSKMVVDSATFYSCQARNQDHTAVSGSELLGTKETPAEDNVPPHESEPSKAFEPASPGKEVIVNSTAQRQIRRTPSRAAKTLREARTSQASNVDHQAFLSTLGRGAEEMPGTGQDVKPIRIGGREVKMVYKDTPSDGLTDDSKNGIGGKRVSKVAKNTTLRRSSRREEVQLAPEDRPQEKDEDSVSETTSAESAASRQTRSSARRASARRSRLR